MAALLAFGRRAAASRASGRSRLSPARRGPADRRLSLLVPKADFARASGLAQSGLAVGQLAAPALAGALVGAFGLQPVLWINCCTFLVSAATLATVRFPRPEPTGVGAAEPTGVWRQALFGLSYIRTRPGLLALVMLFASTNLCQAMVVVLAMPYLLASSPPRGRANGRSLATRSGALRLL
jgi:DHA3 family macrolide efflux protein-like MFS transporter